MTRLPLPIVLPLLIAITAPAWAQTPTPDPARGRMLYELHCIGCHSTQVHWRAKRAATDWPSLKAQVQLWQGNAQLRWSDDDIDAVARHLNDTIYRHPRPATPVGRAGPDTMAAALVRAG